VLIHGNEIVTQQWYFSFNSETSERSIEKLQTLTNESRAPDGQKVNGIGCTRDVIWSVNFLLIMSIDINQNLSQEANDRTEARSA